MRRKRLPARVQEGLPLGANEERYVLAESLTEPTYAIPWSHRIKGPLDLDRLRRAITGVCNRHDVLRTGFEAQDGRYTKYVEALAEPELELRQVPTGDEAEIRRVLRERYFRKPDLTPASLKAFVAVWISANDHVFGFSLHHAISDGQSSRLFVEEVFALYRGETLPSPVQFDTLIDPEWPSSEPYMEAREAWTEALRDLPPSSGWPEELRDTSRSGENDRVLVGIDPEVVTACEGAAREIGVSLFFYMYAVVVLTLSRLTGAADVQTAFQSHGRRAFPDARDVLGSFSNALVLATALDEGESISTLARRVAGGAHEAISREAFPYHHLIRELGVHPSFGVNWFPHLAPPVVPGLEISPADVTDSQSDYDLNFRFVRAAGRIEIVVFYKPSGLGEDRVRAAGALADRLARDVNAPMRSAPSRRFAIGEGLPDTQAALANPPAGVIHARFLRRAAACPDATALSHGSRTHSYAEVEQRSRAVAAGLASAGVGPGDIVALVAERNPSLIWTMLGASRAGAVFVVLDSNYPESRLSALLAIARPKALVSVDGPQTREMAGRLASSSGISLLSLPDGLGADATGEPLDPTDSLAQAYILFTSGSTGQPKGVVCSHAPLTHFVKWQEETFALDASDRFTLLSGLAHDPLLRDVFTPLSIGASIHIPDQEILLAPGALRAWFDEVRPTIAHATPPMGRLLVTSARNHPELTELRHIFWGGDLLPPDLLSEVSAQAPNAEHVNVYGATETPQVVAFHRRRAGSDWKFVPIGRGIDDTQVFVVDAERQPRGVGEVGEIAVRSHFLSLGYLDEAPRDPRAAQGSDAKIYYTGDRGLHLPDGGIVAFGRQDDQIKVRGHRVDLSEVTAALLAHPDVGAAHALAQPHDTGPRIVAFVSGVRLADQPESEVLTYLSERLPDYMLPQSVVRLERLPLMPNGKVDRQRLAALAETPAEPAPAAGPANAAEAQLIAKWSPLLPWTAVGVDSSFFKLGGDSLSYVQVYLATEEVLSSVPYGWQFLSIRQLAGQAQPKRTWVSFVDTPMVIRAISICLVVAGHFHFLRYGGGATAALFVVSGFLFGGLQLPEAIETNSSRPVWRLLASVFVPSVLFTTTLYILKTIFHLHPNISLLFYYGDFQDYSKLSGPYWGGHSYYLWFIDCILHMFLAIGVIMFLLRQKFFFGWNPFGVAGFLFGLGLPARYLLPSFFYPDYFATGVPAQATFHYLPTTHLSTFALGAMACAAITPAQRWIVAGLALPFAVVSSMVYGPNSGLFIGTAVALLLLVRQVVMPRPLSRVFYLLSGASLFIYLTHFQWSRVMKILGVTGDPWFLTPLGILGGIVVWRGWMLVSSRLPAMGRTAATPTL